MNMIDYAVLLDALFGNAQIACLLLLLFGAYLPTLKPGLFVNGPVDAKQQPEVQRSAGPRPVWRRSNGVL
jgi:hypothetical protein